MTRIALVQQQAGADKRANVELFEAEMRVAAFENGYFVALCNRVGADGALTFAGESFVCTPEGTVLARALPGAEHTLLADVDLGATGRSHARQLLFQHRRPELYANWFGPAHGPSGAGL
jgi:N-carbamoylputrescine amidase